MPNYDFLNKETGDIKEYTMSYKAVSYTHLRAHET